MALTISRLFIYPIKSLRAVEVEAIELTDCGVRFDRCFALVEGPAESDRNAHPPLVRHLTIKRTFRMALFHPEIDSTWTKLTIRYIDSAPAAAVVVPLTPSFAKDEKMFKLNIFGTVATGIDMGDEPANFFGRYLQPNTRLVYIGGSGKREIPGVKYAPDYVENVSSVPDQARLQKIKFADASPLLVTSTASEDDVRRRVLEDPRNEDYILRFRPNIHIDVGNSLPAYDEDRWRTLIVKDGTATITCVYPCVRCLSINADTTNGEMSPRTRQLYGLLAQDRRINKALPHKPVYGQYAFGTPLGAIVRVNDEVCITERVP